MKHCGQSQRERKDLDLPGSRTYIDVTRTGGLIVAGGRILLIDDDAQFRRLVNVMLTATGYGLQEATTGTTGVAAYRQERADVVLLDILMPEKEGLETIRELRQIDPNVKIIAMSGSGEGRFGHLAIALRMGAVRILQKPFSRDDLLRTVAEIIGE
jgi:DNA-binding NtrC family response regulator